jgi:succinate dehydrogenase/fumarate reductase flavoprotein subunit
MQIWTTDVVVVGGGAAGCYAALELTKEHIDTIIVCKAACPSGRPHDPDERSGSERSARKHHTKDHTRWCIGRASRKHRQQKQKPRGILYVEL